jgi:hypothetical protein
MAINNTLSFPGKIDNTDLVNYPYGKAQNQSSPGDGTGTPNVADRINDLFGLQQSYLSAAGIAPNNLPDSLTNGQYLQSALLVHGGVGTLAQATATLFAFVGQEWVVTDRGHGVFKFVTGETPNTFDIVAHDTLAIQLQYQPEANSPPAVHHVHVGVVADGDRTDKTVGTDNAAAMNAAFSLSYNLQMDSVLPSGPCRVASPVAVQEGGTFAFDVRSPGAGADARTFIMGDMDVTLLANKNLCLTLGGNMTYDNIAFIHADANLNEDTSVFLHTRGNIDVKQDIDTKFTNCVLSGAEFAATTFGRGWWFDSGSISGLRNGLRIEWPAGFDGGALAPEQQLTTGMRGYRITNSRVHAMNQGHLLVNLGYNRQNANNIQVNGNVIDTACGMIKGSARQSSFADNQSTQLDSLDWIVLGTDNNKDILEDVSFDNNIVTGMDTVDLQTAFNSLVQAIPAALCEITRVSFDNMIIANQVRNIFNLGGCTTTGVTFDNCKLNDILQGNDVSASRYIFSKGTPSATINSFSMVGTSISNYTRTFNQATLFDVSDGNLKAVKAHSNMLDVADVPLFQVVYEQRVGANEQILYTGDGSDPQTIGMTDPIRAAIVSPRTGAGAGQSVTSFKGSSSSNGLLVASDGSNVQVSGNMNLSGHGGFLYVMR